MELIERYIEELRFYLPRDLRDDVASELQSNLGEALERRLSEEGDGEETAIEIELLTELGPPAALADSYVPRPRVLFGPRLYPPFLKTIKIAIGVLVGLAALGVALDIADSPSLWELASSLTSALSSVVTGGLIVLGIVVVVFASIERWGAAPIVIRESWDPRDLRPIEDPDRAGSADVVISIAFLAVAFLVVNFFRSLLGAHVTLDDESGWIPLLGPAFDALLWLFNLCVLLDLAIHVLVLVRQRWSTPLRWAAFAINILWVTWLWRLSRLPAVLQPDPDWMIAHGWSAAAAAEYQELVTGTLTNLLGMGLKLGLLAAFVGLAVQLYKLVRRMFAG